jgi:hypothetical protein
MQFAYRIQLDICNLHFAYAVTSTPKYFMPNQYLAFADTAQAAIKKLANCKNLKLQIATSNGQNVGAVELPGRGGGEADGAGPEILVKHSGSPAGADGVAVGDEDAERERGCVHGAS